MLPVYICSFFETHIPRHDTDFVVEVSDDEEDVTTYSEVDYIDMDANIDAELDRIVEICKQRTMSIMSI